MSKVTAVLLSFFLFFSTPSFSKVSGNEWLVKIGNHTYNVALFRTWWKVLKNPKEKFPKKPTPFIDWLLLSENASDLGLYKLPEYKKKINEFLKVRSLILLQSEVLYKAKQVPEKEVEQFYRQNYLPIIKAVVFFAKTKEQGEKIRQLLEKGKSPSEIAKELKQQKNPHFYKETTKLRPKMVKNEKVRKILHEAKEGTIVGPFFENGFYVVMKVEGVSEWDKDKKRLMASVKDYLEKKREQEATAKFLSKLQKKYNVWVNRTLLKEIDPDKKLSPEMKKKIILRIGNIELTVNAYMQLLQRQLKWEKHVKFNKPSMEKIKDWVMNTIISQTLVSMEARNRHYERKEPLKSLYDFYRRNLLVNMLNNKVISKSIKVSDEEIKSYYEKHKSEYKLPDLYKIEFFQNTDKRLIDKVYSEIKSPQDFKRITIEIMGRDNVAEVPYNKFSDSAKKALKHLNSFGMSEPVKVKNVWFVFRVLNVKKNRYKPLSEVKDKIEKILWQKKFEKAKKEYVKRLYVLALKKGNKIKVNWQAWNALEKEYSSSGSVFGKFGSVALYVAAALIAIVFGISYLKGTNRETA